MKPMVRRSKVQVKISIDLFVERLQALGIFEIWLDIDFFPSRDRAADEASGKTPQPIPAKRAAPRLTVSRTGLIFSGKPCKSALIWARRRFSSELPIVRILSNGGNSATALIASAARASSDSFEHCPKHSRLRCCRLDSNKGSSRFWIRVRRLTAGQVRQKNRNWFIHRSGFPHEV